MSKRAAEVQLTQDNLEEEYDASEVPGQFEVATEDQLKQRVIKVAKRGRALNDGPSAGGVFAGLNTSQPFSLGSKPPVPTLPPSTVAPADVKPPGNAVSGSYLSQLKSLNESVSDWISRHVQTNPFVDLSPIFRDYSTHLVAIERKHKSSGEEVDSPESGCREKETDTEVTTDSQTTDEPASPHSASESQEGSTVQGKESTSDSGEDDSSLLTVRAKLYYKKDSEYTELGVGALKVQKLSDNTVCLLLRNDTSLGTVLLNIRVTAEIPVTSKANYVIVISSPNPPLSKDADNAPVSYLIRMKTSQLAEKLLTTLKENTSTSS